MRQGLDDRSQDGPVENGHVGPPAPAEPEVAWMARPPVRPTPRHLLTAVLTGVVVLALVVGIGVGYALRSGSPSPSVKPPLSGALNASAIASRVDRALVDLNITDGDEGILAAATGMVLSSSGVVLTNNHVIDGATSIRATDIGNHKTYSVRVVGYDYTSDTAVLQLEGARGLAAVSIGNSSVVRDGDQVVAIGNAGGSGGTPSFASGRVTALRQSITAVNDATRTYEQLTGLIETDSPIQAGDSGGPLVNAAGKVIGMDTAASNSYSFSEGTTQGYAIPINAAVLVAQQIRDGDASATVHIGRTAFLGVAVATYFEGSRPGGKVVTAVVVVGVMMGTVAQRVGLAAGDVIVSLNGEGVSTVSQLTTMLQTHQPGDTVRLEWTDVSGGSRTASAVLGTGPAG